MEVMKGVDEGDSGSEFGVCERLVVYEVLLGVSILCGGRVARGCCHGSEASEEEVLL